MKFYISMYGEYEYDGKKYTKVVVESSNASKALEKIFDIFPEHKETEGEDIEYVLAENEVKEDKLMFSIIK